MQPGTWFVLFGVRPHWCLILSLVSTITHNFQLLLSQLLLSWYQSTRLFHPQLQSFVLLLVEPHKVSVDHDLKFLQAPFISPLSTEPCYGWVWQGRGRGSVPHLLDFPQKTVLLWIRLLKVFLCLRVWHSVLVSPLLWGPQGSWVPWSGMC